MLQSRVTTPAGAQGRSGTRASTSIAQCPLRVLALVLNVSSSSRLVNGYAFRSATPWYCPPSAGASATCVSQYRFSRASPYVEETVVPNSGRVAAAIGSEPGASKFAVAAQTFLALLEGVRILMCMFRFRQCYTEVDALRMFDEICTVIQFHQEALEHFRAGGIESVCEALMFHGRWQPLLRSVAQPLQGLVQAALPWVTVPRPGNFGTRFHFEHFFEKHARRYFSGESNLTGTIVPQRLVYPEAFTPGVGCGGLSAADEFARSGGKAFESDDVSVALQRLASSGVQLSRFVVNFGAADGACGYPLNWNYDPANCLTEKGSAALMVEGAAGFYQGLRAKFEGRRDVKMVLKYLPLPEVRGTLRQMIQDTVGFSFSPDLLKIDIDHADCLFAQEALKVIHPKLLHVEYLPLVPPPFDYAQRYQNTLLNVSLLKRVASPLTGDLDAGSRPVIDNDHPGGRELTGCSLSAFLRRCPGYDLVAAGHENALFVRKDLQKKLGVGHPPKTRDAWKQGAFCHPLRGYTAGYVLWGFDWRMLADDELPLKDRMNALTNLLAQHGASEFSLSISDLGQ